MKYDIALTFLLQLLYAFTNILSILVLLFASSKNLIAYPRNAYKAQGDLCQT